jgi:hypothetical protein
MRQLSLFIHTLASVFVATMLTISQAYGDRLFATSGAGESGSILYELDPETGATIHTFGPIGFNAVVSIDFHPDTGVLYGLSNPNGEFSSMQLIKIDTNTGIGTPVHTITGTMAASSFTKSPDMGFASDGTLYTWSERTPDNLNKIDITTGISTEVGDSFLNDTFQTGLAVDSDNNVYIKDGFGDVYIVDRMTGAATFWVKFDGLFVERFDNILAFDSSDNLFMIDRMFFPDMSQISHLYSIDLGTGATTFIGTAGNIGLAAIAFQKSGSESGSGSGSGFEAFSITKAEIQFDDDPLREKFKAEGTFTLAGEGIDPLNEVVTVGAGTALVTIPAGSFVSGAGMYEYKGIILGADVKVKIEQTSVNEFKFKADVKGVDLTDTANPTEIILTIGSKGGNASVRLHGKLKFPAKIKGGKKGGKKGK